VILLGCAVLGPVWRWLDPWDGATRLVQTDPRAEGGASVWWAGVPTVAWTWYLGAFPEILDPRNVGLALGVYSAVTIAGCLVLGRASYLTRAEPFGLLFGWTARLPRGLLPGWSPPRGAEAVLGTMAGGVLFGTVRLSTLWGSLNVAPAALAYATIGVAAGAFGLAGLLVLCGRWSERSGAAERWRRVRCPQCWVWR
jgi:hypothetical protein